MKGVTDSLASSQSGSFRSVTLDYQNTNWFTMAPQRAGWRSGIYSSWELSGRVSAGASSAFQAVRLKPGLGLCVTTKPPWRHVTHKKWRPQKMQFASRQQNPQRLWLVHSKRHFRQVSHFLLCAVQPFPKSLRGCSVVDFGGESNRGLTRVRPPRQFLFICKLADEMN